MDRRDRRRVAAGLLGQGQSVPWRPDGVGFHFVDGEGVLYWAEAPVFEPVEIAEGVAFIGWVWP